MILNDNRRFLKREIEQSQMPERRCVLEGGFRVDVVIRYCVNGRWVPAAN
jgi:hypothetical protein